MNYEKMWYQLKKEMMSPNQPCQSAPKKSALLLMAEIEVMEASNCSVEMHLLDKDKEVHILKKPDSIPPVVLGDKKKSKSFLRRIFHVGE